MTLRFFRCCCCYCYNLIVLSSCATMYAAAVCLSFIIFILTNTPQRIASDSLFSASPCSRSWRWWWKKTSHEESNQIFLVEREKKEIHTKFHSIRLFDYFWPLLWLPRLLAGTAVLLPVRLLFLFHSFLSIFLRFTASVQSFILHHAAHCCIYIFIRLLLFGASGFLFSLSPTPPLSRSFQGEMEFKRKLKWSSFNCMWLV